MEQRNTRYYRWIDNNIVEVRVMGFANENFAKCLITKGPKGDLGKRIKIPIKTLEEEYTKLRPDGTIIFSVVKINNTLKDVLTTVLTRKDIDQGINIPRVVCRQCVLDLFAKQFTPNNADWVGLSISKETCPADLEFENFLACESIESSIVCAYYIGDTLETILSMFNHSPFDKTLQNIFIAHCHALSNGNKSFAEFLIKKGEANGYVQTLRELLELNNFEYDLYRAFDIIPTNLTASDFSHDALTKRAEAVLSDILRARITKSLVLKYDKDIDLEAIHRTYCLASDKDGTVYVVAYLTDQGYEINLESYDSESIRKMLAKMSHSESLQNAYSYIKFNQEKYKK